MTVVRSLRTIGSPLQRPDAVAKVTGRARYADDFTMPGIRHAVYVRADVAHALVTHVDVSAALALPGVDAVFTAADVPAHAFATAGHPYSLDPAHQDAADRRLLTDHVRCDGDEIAVVVAADPLVARQAAALVKATYQLLPVVTTAEQALAPDAPALHPERGGDSGNLLAEHTLSVNDFSEDLLAGADIVVSGAFRTPVVQHCQMENHTAYAYMDDLERIVVVSSTQIPHICRRIVGQALGIPWSRVRVIKPVVGGGFGNKQDVVLEPMVAFLTAKLGGRPVRMALEREETLRSTRTRHAFHMQARLGLQGGRMAALDVDALSNTGAYASHGHSIARAGGVKMAAVYTGLPYRYHARSVYANAPTAGAMRGYGSPQVCFAVESLVDDAARALNVDPLAFRLAHVGRPGALSPVNHKPIATHGLAECLRQGAERFGWAERRAAAARQRKEAEAQGLPVRRGVGLAVFAYGTGTFPVNVESAGARLALQQDGVFHLSCGATEIGQGADAVFAQMAAATLGVDYDRVRVISTQDTDVTPFDPGAYASRQTYVNGLAVRDCAEAMRVLVLESAAALLETSPEHLDLRGSAVFRLDQQADEPALTLENLALRSYYDKRHGSPLVAERGAKADASPPAFGCTFVEVEVDVPLCRTRIAAMLNVHDSGVIINPLLAEGQVHGGMAMGIGWALLEELLLDPATGRVLNPNLLDYKMPGITDVPDLDCLFVETVEPSSAYGNKALGEPPLISPAPALRNAVLDATGVAINEIPLTPKALFRHLRDAGLTGGRHV